MENVQKKNPGGRPKIGMDVLKNGWEKGVIKLAGEGASDVELRVFLGISKELWYRFIEEEPKFRETIKKAKELCEAWWVKNGRTSLRDGKFNSTLWYMNMKNRFGWADKREVQHDTKNGKPLGVIVLPELNQEG